jgi:two-component system cell cycle response regulator DivK
LSELAAAIGRAAAGKRRILSRAEHAPDLVLMDSQLPGIDGFETLRRLREDARTAPTQAVALTAQAMAGDRERFLEDGFDGYISKPIDVPEFIGAVRRYCGAGA